MAPFQPPQLDPNWREDMPSLRHPPQSVEPLRQKALPLPLSSSVHVDGLLAEIVLERIEDVGAHLWLNNVLDVFVDHGLFGLRFAQTNRGKNCAQGRTSRHLRIAQLRNLRLIVDGSAVELHANDDELALSTLWFPAEDELLIRNEMHAAHAVVYPLGTLRPPHN